MIAEADFLGFVDAFRELLAEKLSDGRHHNEFEWLSQN